MLTFARNLSSANKVIQPWPSKLSRLLCRRCLAIKRECCGGFVGALWGLCGGFVGASVLKVLGHQSFGGFCVEGAWPSNTNAVGVLWGLCGCFVGALWGGGPTLVTFERHLSSTRWPNLGRIRLHAAQPWSHLRETRLQPARWPTLVAFGRSNLGRIRAKPFANAVVRPDQSDNQWGTMHELVRRFNSRKLAAP